MTHAAKITVAGSLSVLLGIAGLLSFTQSASATATVVDLGTAASYSVLGGQSVTNTGPSVLNADLGVSPGTAITGFPPGLSNGATHGADAHALQAQSDLVIAYNATAGQATDESMSGELGGLTKKAGVHTGSSSIGLTGSLTLDAEGNPDAVFVFQIGSTLTTATSSSVKLINGARACNVFWQVGSSATLGTDTTFVGSIMALTSISANTGATVDGRALARNGSVTLDTNTFIGGICDPGPSTSPSATSTATTSPTVTATSTATTSPTVTATSTATTSPTVTSTSTATTSPTVTSTSTATTSPTVTSTSTATTSPSASTTVTASPSVTATASTSPTVTASALPTATSTNGPIVVRPKLPNAGW